jgi:2-polyprenyl-3-methyl-5-hydroxy-6-metoxy-1,4-benzoquinol methylase
MEKESPVPDTMSNSRPLTHQASGLKQDYFDRYWVTRDYVRTDRRTMERAQLVWSGVTRRQGKALDVGCGRGLFAAFLAEQGLVVEATDISPQAVELTAQRGINAYVLDLEEKTPLGLYDVVFCLEVLQQVRDPLSVLHRLVSLLADDGEIVVSVPNEFHLVRRLQILLGHPNFGDVSDSHLKLFTPARAEALLRAAGLSIRTRLCTSIVPPQPAWLASFGRAAAGLWPSGLALSTVYFARKVAP